MSEIKKKSTAKKLSSLAGLPSPMVVVLDLDATLIYSMEEACYEKLKLEKPKVPKFSFRIDGFVVFKRTFVDFLLRFLYQHQVPWVVWTAGTKAYAKDIVTNLLKSHPKLKPLKIWSQNDCVPVEIQHSPSEPKYQWDFCKPLSKLSRALKFKVNNFIIIDDYIDSVCLNLTNWIPISEYDNSTYRQTKKKDDALKRITEYLLHLKQIHDDEPTLDLRQLDHTRWCHYLDS